MTSFAKIYWLISLSLFIVGCNFNLDKNKDLVTIDLSTHEDLKYARPSADAPLPLNVAVGAMLSPKETYVFYEDLFKHISAKTGSKIIFKQRKTYEGVNQMIGNNEVDLAIICSGAYVAGKEKNNMEILAIPVSNGKKHYQAYIIAHVDSNINKFEDFKGKTFAFSDPISHSGKFYVDKRLTEIGYGTDFFSKTIFSNAHDISIQLVSKKIVDGSSVKGTIYDYLEKFHPERIKNLKVVEKSELYGMPPIVVPQALDEHKKEELRNLFLTLHEDPEGKKILENLLIDRFILGDDNDYNSIREIYSLMQP